MKQDVWTNTKTLVESGVNGPLGSPRAWFRRALDTHNIDAVTFQDGSLTPHEISVAGIWYRPCSVPITGMYRELFRFFEIPEAHNISRPSHLVPGVRAIGMCAAVPMSEIVKWVKIYKDHGATFTWWKKPEDRSPRVAKSVVSERRRTDHTEVFKLLDLGRTRNQISEILGLPKPNIDYIVKKWEKMNVKA